MVTRVCVRQCRRLFPRLSRLVSRGSVGRPARGKSRQRSAASLLDSSLEFAFRLGGWIAEPASTTTRAGKLTLAACVWPDSPASAAKMGAGVSSSTPSKASSKPANAYCSLFSPLPTIRRATGSDKVIVWKLMDENGAHCVRLEHDVFSGRRLILVDDAVVFEKSRQLLDTGSNHAFSIGRGLKCVVSIIETGLQFGYALTINEQNFARYREQFWKYSALWRVPKSGVLRTGSAIQWPAGGGAQASSTGLSTGDAAAAAAADSVAASALAGSSSSPAAPASPSILPRFHTVVVLSHPQLTVLLNGRPVELQSSFSAPDSTDPDDSTKHTFKIPKGSDEEEDDEDDENSNASSAASAAASCPSSASSFLDCELTVWLSKDSECLPLGSVSSHVPRDKKHGKTRYLLRVNGAILAQAPSPLVSLHKSLHSSQSGGTNTNTPSGGGGGGGGQTARSGISHAASSLEVCTGSIHPTNTALRGSSGSFGGSASPSLPLPLPPLSHPSADPPRSSDGGDGGGGGVGESLPPSAGSPLLPLLTPETIVIPE